MIDVKLFKNDLNDLMFTNEFSWQLQSYEEDTMDIKLIFDNPLEISTSGYDKIRVTFLNTILMYDYFGQELEEGIFIEIQVPPQFASQAEAEVFIAIEELT